jgi:translocation protein SEC63
VEKQVQKRLAEEEISEFRSLKKGGDEKCRQVCLLLIAHVLRIEVKPEMRDIQYTVVETAGRLITNGMLHIAIARNWLNVTAQILDFSQIITQAMLPHQSPLFQLPYVDRTMLKHFSTKKRNIASISEFLKLTTEDQKDLLRQLDDRQFHAVVEVAKQIPQVKIVDAEYSVFGETAIVPSSLVTLSVKFRCVFDNHDPKEDDNSIPDPEEEKKQKQWWLKKDVVEKQPYCPYFPGTNQPVFTVILANQNIGRLINSTRVAGLYQDHVVRLQFQSPPEPGSWTFQVYVKNDTFFGSDAQINLKVFVCLYSLPSNLNQFCHH